MNRREFLQSSLAGGVFVGGLAGLPFARAGSGRQIDGWRSFELSTEVEIAEPAARTRLWLPVPLAADTDYQRALDLRWDAPGASRAGLVAAPGDDVRMLHVEWPHARSVGPVVLTARVATRDRRTDLAGVRADTPASDGAAEALEPYLRPTALLPTDGIVKRTAERIVRGREGAIDQARAIYAWVVDSTHRDPQTPGCGMGDVSYLLESGNLGGKCADINALFVALARAAGIPARDAYGVRVAASRWGFDCLGKHGDVSKAQHCRAEFHAPGRGWIPVDPADVRKLMLEETPDGLPADHPKVERARALLFGAWEMNWIAFNHGHDVRLPGSDKGPLAFLMYPHGETAEGRLDSLDPATFRYRMSAREIAA